MPSCRCSCTAYGGACDCRADGLATGRLKGLDEAVTGIAVWLRRRAADLAGHDEAAALDVLADEIAAGDWRRP